MFTPGAFARAEGGGGEGVEGKFGGEVGVGEDSGGVGGAEVLGYGVGVGTVLLMRHCSCDTAHAALFVRQSVDRRFETLTESFLGNFSGMYDRRVGFQLVFSPS